MTEKSGEKKIIVIRRKKRRHEGAHGGSWKVAYADFVTAMMALFLLLWLLAMVSPERKQVLADFFKRFSVFSHGQSFMPGSQQALKGEGLGISLGESQAIRADGSNEERLDSFRLKISGEIMEGLGGQNADQMIVETIEGGLKVQIVDKDGSPMFQSGSPQLTPAAKRIIKTLAENMKIIPFQVVIEGHTDGVGAGGTDAANWDLSSTRALNAMKELVASGVDPARIEKVVGYADRQPLYKDNPYDARNRRISFTILMRDMETRRSENSNIAAPNIPEINTAPEAPRQ